MRCSREQKILLRCGNGSGARFAKLKLLQALTGFEPGEFVRLLDLFEAQHAATRQKSTRIVGSLPGLSAPNARWRDDVQPARPPEASPCLLQTGKLHPIREVNAPQ